MRLFGGSLILIKIIGWDGPMALSFALDDIDN